MCCEPSGLDESEINGECEECGAPLCDGEPYEYCSYSPEDCGHCGTRYCDQSC